MNVTLLIALALLAAGLWLRRAKACPAEAKQIDLSELGQRGVEIGNKVQVGITGEEVAQILNAAQPKKVWLCYTHSRPPRHWEVVCTDHEGRTVFRTGRSEVIHRAAIENYARTRDADVIWK